MRSLPCCAGTRPRIVAQEPRSLVDPMRKPKAFDSSSPPRDRDWREVQKAVMDFCKAAGPKAGMPEGLLHAERVDGACIVVCVWRRNDLPFPRYQVLSVDAETLEATCLKEPPAVGGGSGG